jgi:hypothetical protein
MLKKKASQLFLIERLWVWVGNLVFGFIYSITNLFIGIILLFKNTIIIIIFIKL